MIKKNDVVKTLWDQKSEWDFEYNLPIDRCIVAVKGLPQEQEWISVEERLPELHEKVLAAVGDEIIIAWLFMKDRWGSAAMSQQVLNDGRLRYWMSLPQLP